MATKLSVSIPSGSAAAQRLHPQAGPMSTQGETCSQEATYSWIMGLGGTGRSGNTADNAAIPLFWGRAGLWKLNEKKVLTRHLSVLLPHRETPLFFPSFSPLDPSHDAFPQTHSPHLKVITFKIAFSKQQTALVHPSPWALARPSVGLLPSPGNYEPEMVSTSGSLCVWHQWGVNTFSHFHLEPISWQ